MTATSTGVLSDQGIDSNNLFHARQGQPTSSFRLATAQSNTSRHSHQLLNNGHDSHCESFTKPTRFSTKAYEYHSHGPIKKLDESCPTNKTSTVVFGENENHANTDLVSISPGAVSPSTSLNTQLDCKTILPTISPCISPIDGDLEPAFALPACITELWFLSSDGHSSFDSDLFSCSSVYGQLSNASSRDSSPSGSYGTEKSILDGLTNDTSLDEFHALNLPFRKCWSSQESAFTWSSCSRDSSDNSKFSDSFAQQCLITELLTPKTNNELPEPKGVSPVSSKDVVVYLRLPGEYEALAVPIRFDSNLFPSIHDFIETLLRVSRNHSDICHNQLYNCWFSECTNDITNSYNKFNSCTEHGSNTDKWQWLLKTLAGGKLITSCDAILKSPETKFALYLTKRTTAKVANLAARSSSDGGHHSSRKRHRSTSKHSRHRGHKDYYGGYSHRGDAKLSQSKSRSASVSGSKLARLPPIFRTVSDSRLFGIVKKNNKFNTGSKNSSKIRSKSSSKSVSSSKKGLGSTITYQYRDERNYNNYYSNPTVYRSKSSKGGTYYNASSYKTLTTANSSDIYIIPNHRSYSYVGKSSSKRGGDGVRSYSNYSLPDNRRRHKKGGRYKTGGTVGRGTGRRRKRESDGKKHSEDYNEGVVKESDWIMPIKRKDFIEKRFKFDKEIGDGNFAVVYRCYNRKTKEWIAMKEIDKSKVKGKSQYIENEVELLARCRHPNIIRLISAYQNSHYYYVSLELLEYGDLFESIKSTGSFSESVTAGIVYDVASALSYLHKNDVVHRDLKPENILLTSDFRSKLADFGLACKVLGPLYRVCGTPTYVAPEILAQTGYEVEVDLWSLGIITYIMICGYAPFRHTEKQKLFKKIKEGKFSFDSKPWDKISEGATKFISKLLRVEPTERWTANEVMQNRWVRRRKSR